MTMFYMDGSNQMQRKHKKINTCKICGQDIFNRTKLAIFCKKCAREMKPKYQHEYYLKKNMTKLRKKFKNLDELIENFERF